MPNSTLIHANILICENVLTEEKTRLQSAIRLFDAYAIAASASSLHFFVLSDLRCTPFDVATHTLTIQMVGEREGKPIVVAGSQPKEFRYGYAVNWNGPGGYILTTEFNLDLNTFGPLGLFYIQAWLDGNMAAQVPLMLRRQ